MTIDIDAIRKEWLRQCGLCDAGLLTECTCPKGDVRALISTLCDRDDELTAERDAHAIAAEQNRSELDMVRTLDRQEIARLNAALAEKDAQLTAANRRADGLQADLDSATKANTAWANENAELKAERDQFRNSAALFAITTSDLTRQFSSIHVLCEAYKDQPPPIFQGPSLSEHGKGYNAGTRDMARAVLSAMSTAEQVAR